MAHKSTNLRYEVLGKIGEGSLFVVYRVRDHLLNQTVALKVLRPELAHHAPLVQAVWQSADVATRLLHANAAHVLSVGEEDGTTFLVTEYVPGKALADILAKRSPLPCAEAVDIAVRIAEVLHDAHQNGIVHGNLHPRNIIVTRNGSVKVTDFALAEAYALPVLAHDKAALRAAPYVSPERASGHDLAPTDDLYALGVVLYQMLTGALPLGVTPGQPSPLRLCTPEVPAALERIVTTLLADEEQRYPTAHLLLRDLRRIASGSDAISEDEVPIVVKVKPAHRRQQWQQRRHAWEKEDRLARLNHILWILALVLVVLVVGMGSVFFFVLYQGPPEVRVPDIEGKPLGQARQMLKERGLDFVEERVFSDKAPLDTVLSVDPEPGRKIKQRRIVKLTVSNGEELLRVPDVTGMMLEPAKKILLQQGFKVGNIVQQHHDIASKGEVLAQSVRADAAVPKETKIDLFISKGPQPEPPPDAQGVVQPPRDYGAHVEGVVTIRLTVPSGASWQEVKIVVRDALGEHTAYEQYHAPGDLVEHEINVSIAPLQRALIRVFVAGELVKEQPVMPSELMTPFQ